MIYNDILKRVRFTFDLSDSKMMAVFAAADKKVSRAQISDWLKKEDDPAFVECDDQTLAAFLNGFINIKRGKREGKQPKPETHLTNNLIFKKLRIALALKDEDILNILSLVDFKLSKHELSAFFRAPEHRQSRQCKDQVLRNFLNGMQKHYRPKGDTPQPAKPKKAASIAKPQRKTLSLGNPKSKFNDSDKPSIKTFQWKEK